MKLALAILLSVFRIAVVPAQFQDREFTYGEKDIQGVLDKATEYLDTQFRGSTTFEFTLLPPVTLKHDSAWYGENGPGDHDHRIADAVTEACKAANPDFDFSLLDGDEDGKIDCIALLTAGLSESDGAGDGAIWPRQGWLHEKSSTFTLDGKTADAFIVTTEIKSDFGENERLNGIGDICHEILHIFGVPDFYDTDGETSGLGTALWKTTSLMDGGNRNDSGRTPPNLNAIEMECLGLGTCDTLKTGRYSLSPIDVGSRYLKALSPKEDEYMLLECRKAEGWDEFIGGEGLLVYHVDRSKPTYSDFWKNNRVNADASRQGAYILAADPEADDVSKVFFPREGSTALSSDSTPAFRFHDGTCSPLAISGITLAEDGSVSFLVLEPVKLMAEMIFQDAAILHWTVGEGISRGAATVRWFLDGEEIGSAEVYGTDTFTVEHLKPQTNYEASVTVHTVYGEPCSSRIGFRTKTYRSEIKPYIYLRDADRAEDGSFIRGARIPLRIFNVADAEETVWSFNGHPVSTGPDGFFTISEAGRLKAKIYHSDGSVDIIIKDIAVK